MVRYSVTVPPRIIAGLRRQAAAELPAECCGALVGELHRDRIEVRAQIPLVNAASDPASYRIDASVVRRLERRAECAGLSVVGFYHSHPAGLATPSATDLEHACPGYLYVIVDRQGAVRAWRLRDERNGFAELTLLDPLAGAA
jgi:desampylase